MVYSALIFALWYLLKILDVLILLGNLNGCFYFRRKEVDKMKELILAIVMGVLTFAGTIFICILSANKNEIWEKIRSDD